jgi:pimeloyl-ACP methyl ester carboxylesterase
MDTVISADGTDVAVYDEGAGPVILMVHPGLDDGTRSKKLAALLARRFRVLRVHRRQYRADLKAGGTPCSIAQEAEDVLAVARAVGEPVLVYGHSSGAVVTLEALAASASSSPFAGAVLFEPPAMIRPATDEEAGILVRARAAVHADRPAKAMRIFVREAVGLPLWQATLMGAFTALNAHNRGLAPFQVDDLEALQRLGVRLDAYVRITVPTVLLGGDRSPVNLAERLDALKQVMPHSERVVMPGRDHGADLRAPEDVARVVETLADKVLHR